MVANEGLVVIDNLKIRRDIHSTNAFHDEIGSSRGLWLPYVGNTAG